MTTEGGRRFAALPRARRDAIILASMRVFARHGYRDANTADIARAAGMSKGLLFFYFRNKRDLYLNTVDYVSTVMGEAVVDDAAWAIDDFFDLIMHLCRRKRAELARHPLMLRFALAAWYPSHRDVAPTVNRWMQRQITVMYERYLSHVRLDRFRDDVDPRHVLDMLIWLADGYLHRQVGLGLPVDLDDMLVQCGQWCAMLRRYAYRQPDGPAPDGDAPARPDGAAPDRDGAVGGRRPSGPPSSVPAPRDRPTTERMTI